MKTPEQKLEAKEAKLKKDSDLVAFLGNEVKTAANEAEQPETPLVLLVCGASSCPLKGTASGPYKTCSLCLARQRAQPSKTS